MSKYNILVKVTGSIAAYKTAYLISKLVQDGNDVKVVASKSALEFIGKATLEGLTANPVYTDSFEQGKMMSHINLVKWADLTILCPASANSINKLANGIGDTLLTSLFLAHDCNKPYLIAPAMNTAMFDHPATKASLAKLKEWGVAILKTSEGYLACGDYGSGKLLEPDDIYKIIYDHLPFQKSREKILITSGGTKENIDGIREITNISTGKTAASIAQHFINNNYNVHYLHAENATKPNGKYTSHTFVDFDSLNNELIKLLKENHFDLIIHNAAVSDYRLQEILQDGKSYPVPIQQKISSGSNELTFKLKRNIKIVKELRNYSVNKNIKIIAFKFTNELNEASRAEHVNKLFESAKPKLVVQNDFNDRSEHNHQHNFNIYDSNGKIKSAHDATELAKSVEEIIFENFNGANQ